MPQFKLILIGIALAWGCGAAGMGRKPETRYLALGDSYTIGESVDPDERYPAQVRRLLAAADHLDCGNPEIIAVTGWTTGNLLGALADVAPGDSGGRQGTT